MTTDPLPDGAPEEIEDDDDSLGRWDPLTPAQVYEALRDLHVPWWIAGGWAIDAFVGRETREHGDIDVGVLRRDQVVVQGALDGWDLQAADPPGKLRRWQPRETLPMSVHDIWCRPDSEAAWGLQLMLEESDGSKWFYRRNQGIVLPVASIAWRDDDGVPYLVPEVQLLYKAARQSPANESDFEACLPLLDEEQRTWLGIALVIAHPGHPWIERLRPNVDTEGA